MSKIKILFTLVALALCCACGDRENGAESLTVSAAISLKDAFDEIGAAFQAKTGKKVNFNYGASGALQRQIETGAPVDIFAGAGEKQLNELDQRGFLITATRRNFAGNSLVLIVPKDSELNIRQLRDLTETEVTKIAVGNPKTVPAGQYAEESLTNLNLKDHLQAKLILAENARQVLDYVVRGEVDAGIVYGTDALAAKEKVNVAEIIDRSSHSMILYPLAIVKNSEQMQAAQEFTDFVMSAEGQKILQKYGFRGEAEK